MTERREFQRCYAEGRKSFSKSFVIFIAQREESAMPWRLGMAVTRKTGPAVYRNRIRRLIREYFRLMQVRILPGCDYVVVPKRQASFDGVTLERIQRELEPLVTSRGSTS